MGKIQNYSDIKKKSKSREFIDKCPVCSKNLYLNEEYTKRVGIVDEEDEVLGWMCPFCKSEFDVDSKLLKLMGFTTRGEA